jgi:hypothetical protein
MVQSEESNLFHKNSNSHNDAQRDEVLFQNLNFLICFNFVQQIIFQFQVFLLQMYMLSQGKAKEDV